MPGWRVSCRSGSSIKRRNNARGTGETPHSSDRSVGSRRPKRVLEALLPLPLSILAADLSVLGPIAYGLCSGVDVTAAARVVSLVTQKPSAGGVGRRSRLSPHTRISHSAASE
jgi:hypothetical protein